MQLLGPTADGEMARAFVRPHFAFERQPMETTIPTLRSDVVAVPTSPRPTAIPPRVQFADVLAGGARALVTGAQAAVRALPGAPLVAVALRGGPSASTTASATVAIGGASPPLPPTGSAPEGPGGSSSPAIVSSPSSATGTPDGGIESSMAQAEQMNLYYLQVQEEVNSQNRTFTALSNVLEVEHSTAKAAIGNIH